MKSRSIRRILTIALPAALLAFGVYSLRTPAHPAQSAQLVSAAHNPYVETSCARVGAWCADAERTALAGLAQSSNAATPFVRTSCDTVGGWCADAERAAQARIQSQAQSLPTYASCASVGAWCADAERIAIKRQLALQATQ